jgi:hypothetical protein
MNMSKDDIIDDWNNKRIDGTDFHAVVERYIKSGGVETPTIGSKFYKKV